MRSNKNGEDGDTIKLNGKNLEQVKIPWKYSDKQRLLHYRDKITDCTSKGCLYLKKRAANKKVLYKVEKEND